MATIDLGETYQYPTGTGNYYGPTDPRRVPGPYPGTEQVTVQPSARAINTGGYGSAFPASTVSRPYGSTGAQTPSTPRISSQTNTSTPVAPDMAMPSFGNVPAIDETRIKRLTQTRSAAGQRSLRAALRENLLQASYQDNPNVAAMISRKSLEGFGQGIAETYTKAQQQATAEEYRDRQMKFSKQQAVFNAAMQDYMKRFGEKRTTDYAYTNSGASGGAGEIQTENPRIANYMSPAQAARQEMMAAIHAR